MMWLRRCGLQWHSCLNVRESSGTGRDDGERLWQGAGGAGNRIVRGQNKDMIKETQSRKIFCVSLSPVTLHEFQSYSILISSEDQITVSYSGERQLARMDK